MEPEGGTEGGREATGVFCAQKLQMERVDSRWTAAATLVIACCCYSYWCFCCCYSSCFFADSQHASNARKNFFGCGWDDKRRGGRSTRRGYADAGY